MTDLFLSILEISFYGSVVIVIILGLRLVLKKAPRSAICFLWLLAALRLVCPFTIESSLSLQPTREELSSAPIQFLPREEQTQQNTAVNPGDYGSGTQVEQEQQQLQPVAPNQSQTVTPDTELNTNTNTGDNTGSRNPAITTTPDTEPDYAAIAAWLWITGMALMAVYTTVSYLRLKRLVKDSYVLGQDLFLCPGLDSAFVLGFFKPQIFLPEGLSDESQHYVVAHERAHIARKDHLWKLVGFTVLTLHWFNPLVWLSYNLLCKDIEMACDERVVRDMDVAQRKAYSTALLACAAKRSGISACPVAFGETSVKERIKMVLNYKKPGFWITLVAVIAAIAVAVCFLTSPKASDEIGRCEEALSRWQEMKHYHLTDVCTFEGDLALNDNATDDFWVNGDDRTRRTAINLDNGYVEYWYRYQDGQERCRDISVDENGKSDTGWIEEQPDGDVQMLTIPWVMSLDWDACEFTLESCEAQEDGGEVIQLSVAEPEADPSSYTLYFELDANGDLEKLTLVFVETAEDPVAGVASLVHTRVATIEEYEATETQIPEGMAELNTMIEGTDISLLVAGDQIRLEEAGMTVTLSTDSGLVYREGYVMAVMDSIPQIDGDTVLVDDVFYEEFLCGGDSLVEEASLFHGVMFFADEILNALEQPDASVFDQKLLAEVLLPASMGIETPHVDMDRVFQSQPLSQYAAALTQELEGLGYENAASYTYSEYVILTGAQTLKQAGISDGSFDENMTVAEYHRLLKQKSVREFERGLNAAQREFAERMQIEMEDLYYLNRLYPGEYMSQSAEVLKAALEESYAADISYLEGMAGDSTETNTPDNETAELPWDIPEQYNLSYKDYFGGGLRNYLGTQNAVSYAPIWYTSEGTYHVRQEGQTIIVSNGISDVYSFDTYMTQDQVQWVAAGPQWIYGIRNTTELFRMDYFGQTEEILFDDRVHTIGGEGVECPVALADGDVLFFVVCSDSGSLIYRLYLPEKKLDQVAQTFAPTVSLTEVLAAQAFTWNEPNPEFESLLEKLIRENNSEYVSGGTIQKEMYDWISTAYNVPISYQHLTDTRTGQTFTSAYYGAYAERVNTVELAKLGIQFESGCTWYNMALTSRYESTNQINLSNLFYNGFADESHRFTEKELEGLKALEEQGILLVSEDFDMTRLPVDKMNAVLEMYFGTTLDQLDEECFEGLVYLESTDCYYFKVQHTDSLSAENITITAFQTLEDGTVNVYYSMDDWQASGDFSVSLRQYDNVWQIVSNLQVVN